MASLHELHTYDYEIPDECQTSSRHELHADAGTDKRAKPDNVGCSPWIICSIGIVAVLGLCVSVTILVLLFTSSGKIFNKTETYPDEHNQYGGSTYIRWGRTVCPETSTLVYDGLAGGKWYKQSGSGSNYLCLPRDPEYDEYETGQQEQTARVFTAEYQLEDFQSLSDKAEYDVPCAVCHITNRTSFMFPAKMTCPSGWIGEYYGYLMAERYDHHSSEFVCVDRSPEIVPGSVDDKNGALFYPTEGRCPSGNLPCLPYIDGAELTCVVCSK